MSPVSLSASIPFGVILYNVFSSNFVEVTYSADIKSNKNC